MRLSWAWQPGCAKSFRNRSGKIFKTWGRNGQNISPAEKRYLLADPGKLIIQRDVSGAEAVIVGFLCRPGPYRDLSIYGVKHHSYIAAHLYRNEWKKETSYDIDHLLKLSIRDLADNPEWKAFAKVIKATDDLEGKARRYYLGKKTGLSYNYEEGPNTFRFTVLKESEGTIVLSKEEADYFRSLYLHTLFPEIPEWQQRVKDQALQHRVIYNLYGFPFNITSHLPSDKTFRECIAWTPQSTVGVLGTNGFVEMQEWSEQHPAAGCDVLLNVHDSVVCQCFPEAADEVDAAMAAALEPTFVSPVDGEEFKMKTESTRGYNLAKYHPEKNPEGLK